MTDFNIPADMFTLGLQDDDEGLERILKFAALMNVDEDAATATWQSCMDEHNRQYQMAQLKESISNTAVITEYDEHYDILKLAHDLGLPVHFDYDEGEDCFRLAILEKSTKSRVGSTKGKYQYYWCGKPIDSLRIGVIAAFGEDCDPIRLAKSPHDFDSSRWTTPTSKMSLWNALAALKLRENFERKSID